MIEFTSTAIPVLQLIAWKISDEHGFHEDVVSDDPWVLMSRMALIHSEVSEALEDIRVGSMETFTDEKGKLRGFPTEMADIVIRVFDTCEELGIDLESEILAKMQFNDSRPYKHGKKA